MLLALYVRVSTDRQAEQGASVPDQIAQMQAWADQNGHTVAAIYEEAGTARDDRRPAFQEMMDAATSDEHPFDAVVVHSQSRFFRQAYLFALYERKLLKAKVQLVSITQPVGDTTAGEMARQIFSVFDEYTSKEISKHVTRCMLENARKGFFNGAKPTYGYASVATDLKSRSGHKKRLEINKEEAEVVRLIFQLSAYGRDGRLFGTKRIAEYLNLNGMLNRGRPWTLQRVGKILNDTIYIGEYVYNRHDSRGKEPKPREEWIIVPVPPIVDKQTFEVAAAARAERRLTNHGNKAIQSRSLLTGIAVCGCCKKGLVLMTGKSGRYIYYRCITKISSGVSLCDCPNVPKEQLEALVLTTLAEKVLNPERVMAILRELKNQLAAASQPDLQKQREHQREIASIQEKLVRLYEEVGEGKLELSNSLTEYIAGLSRKQAFLAGQVAVLRSRHTLPLKSFGEQQVRAFTDAVQSVLLTPDSPYAKQYLATFVSKIVITRETAEMSGSNLMLAAAISKWKLGTPLTGVPSIAAEWCRLSDSN